MSDKQNIQKSVDTLKRLENNIKEAVNKAVEEVNKTRQKGKE